MTCRPPLTTAGGLDLVLLRHAVRDDVVVVVAVKDVEARPAVEVVAAGASLEAVVPAVAVDRIVERASGEVVGAAAAVQLTDRAGEGERDHVVQWPEEGEEAGDARGVRAPRGGHQTERRLWEGDASRAGG